MNRRTFLMTASLAAVFAAGPAFADNVGNVRSQLQKQGYNQISVSSTLLGRSRIVARGKRGTREIIMNPRTGEILRDQMTMAGGTSGPSIAGNDDNGDDNGKSHGSDDKGGDDNGSGSGDNSGHGSGGDDSGGDGGDSGGDSGGDGDGGGDGGGGHGGDGGGDD